jgi:hypothetical protein
MRKWAMWLNFVQQFESFFFFEGFKIEIYRKTVENLIDELVKIQKFELVLTSALSYNQEQIVKDYLF